MTPRISLVFDDEMQARMIVVLWQQFQAATEADHEQALACFMANVDNALKNKASATGLGQKLQRLHELVGCGENCQHKGGGS